MFIVQIFDLKLGFMGVYKIILEVDYQKITT